MKEDIPLPFGLPEAALKYAPGRMSRLQAVKGDFPRNSHWQVFGSLRFGN
jgi:hypothetical protein